MIKISNLINTLGIGMILSIAITGCVGSTSTNGNNSAGTISPNTDTSSSTDNIYFKNILAIDDTPIYSISQTYANYDNNPTKIGVITYSPTGFSVPITDGHHGSSEIALWLVSWGYGGFNTSTTNVKADNFNYAFVGNLNFYYNQDSGSSFNNESFSCNGIAIAEIHDIKGKDTWMLYSNMTPGLALISDYTDESQSISCINNASGITQIFKISGYNINTFTVTPESYSSANFGVILDNPTFGQQLSHAYSHLSKTDSLLYWANNEFDLTSNSNDNLVSIFNFNDFSALSMESGDAEIVGALTVESSTPIFLGTDTLTNSTAIQETLGTSSFSKAVTNSTTTNTNCSVAVGGALNLETGAIENLVIKGGVSFNAQFSYQHGRSTTTSTTYTYTSPVQTVSILPMTAAVVTTQLEQAAISGNFAYEVIASGFMPTDGLLFYANNQPNNYANGSIPLMLASQQNINVFNVFANTSAILSSQIGVNESNQTVSLFGGGTITGNVGSNYIVNVTMYALNSDGTIDYNHQESSYSARLPVESVPQLVNQSVSTSKIPVIDHSPKLYTGCIHW